MANLNDINKNNSFEVPDNYFENFTLDIQTKISEENLRDTFGNENPFSVPDNYFNNFQVKQGKDISISSFQKLKPYLSIAAAVVLVFTIWQLTLTIISNQDNSIVEGNDNNTTIENIYLSDNIDLSDIELTENEIEMYLNGTDENALLTLDNTEDNSIILNIENDVIYDYLNDYSDDISEYREVLAKL